MLTKMLHLILVVVISFISFTLAAGALSPVPLARVLKCDTTNPRQIWRLGIPESGYIRNGVANLCESY